MKGDFCALVSEGNKDKLPIYKGKFLFQMKIDGICAEWYPQEKQIIDKQGKDITREYPLIVKDLIKQNLTEKQHIEICYKNLAETRMLINRSKCKAYIHDIINFDLPLEDRQRWIWENIRETEHVEIVKTYEDYAEIWERVLKEKMEGIVAKRKGSKYFLGYSWDWLKIKNWKDVELRATGYEEHPKGLTLTTETGDRVVCNGKQSKAIKNIIDKKGYCWFEAQKLDDESNNRFISFKRTIQRI